MTSAAPGLVPDVLTARAALQPDAVALVVDGVGSLTFGRWEARSNAFARGLAARRVQPGDRVGLLFDGERWLDFAVAHFGTMKAGAVVVPLAADKPQSQVDAILTGYGTTSLCCPPDLTPSTSTVWDPLEVEHGQSEAPFPARVGPAGLAQILATSGTTGLPKGVACTHANLLHGIVTSGPALAEARAGIVAMHALPVSANAAQGELIRGAHRLARTVIMAGFEPERCAELVAGHAVTVLLLVPSMATMIVNVGAFERHDASSVRRLRLTGAPSPPSLLRRLADAVPQAEVMNEYALTESMPAAVTTIYDPRRPASVGRVGPDELRVVGDGLERCPPGVLGEVWLARPGAPPRWYFGDTEATDAVFAGGWVRTGDMGYLDDDGYLYLTDRKGDEIMIGGRNVSTIEVEAVLHECPAVAEAAVFALPHGVLGQSVAAAVVLRGPMTPAQLKAFAGQRLAGHATPQTVFFVDELPRTTSGKVKKRELADRLGAEPKQAHIRPRTPTEAGLASIWCGLLGLEAVSVTDRFVDLGGQSISAFQMLVEIERRYGVSLPTRVFYEAETIAALAPVVDAALPCRSGHV